MLFLSIFYFYRSTRKNKAEAAQWKGKFVTFVEPRFKRGLSFVGKWTFVIKLRDICYGYLKVQRVDSDTIIFSKKLMGNMESKALYSS